MSPALGSNVIDFSSKALMWREVPENEKTMDLAIVIIA